MSETETTERRCEFCGDVKDSRGLYAHVMHSDGNGHGPAGSVPEGFNPREAPIVSEDEETVEVNLEGEFTNRLLMCHYCGEMGRGKGGFAVHLSKTAGDELHPPDVSIENEDYTSIPADEDWNPIVDQSELNELHQEITGDIDEYELYQPEGGDSSEDDSLISDAELQEMVDRAVIPHQESKVEQVASLLNQVPELYDRPEAVKEIIDCSTTTYYEGRKLHENQTTDLSGPVRSEENSERVDRVDAIAWESQGQSVIIDGEQYVPVSVLKNLIRNVNEVNAKLNEATTEGAKIIHRSQ